MLHKHTKAYRTYMIIVAIILGLCYTYIKSSPIVSGADLQKGISEKIIRFHVIANSDSEEDYELKLKVKQAVVDYVSPLLKDSTSLTMSEQILNEHYDEILSIAKTIVSENGYDYPVYCTIGYEYFPTKAYGSYTFPPGEYKAFQIKIGEARGSNWWCVLYPPLCFIDLCHGTYEMDGDAELSNILSEEEYQSVNGNCVVKYRFKYLTFLNKFADIF